MHYLILLCIPLCFVASPFLGKEPPLLALFGVFGWDDLCNLLPIVIGEVLDVLVLCDHKGE